uniref:Pseudouridine synthase n=1 Tax=Candidatus Kentrum eta TaxID=2126337 RepID=A0A450V6D4_9GAMM|nr:MAG: ribosomal large subunit pseudouridine synthase B [Candidatus Kentron sp. H]VFK00337.1 MAG: ribosomal large subunit pseudouridine synthase B [Candidatus Kentron sp. H]VFK04508.1 MAG: ribosomal large subunit pseudouridine synthase B [Candidatus Kentron sp. H]
MTVKGKTPIQSPSPSPASEKLQKVLAAAGLGSRRALEYWIEAGRVSVNGARAKLGARVSRSDLIRVDGRRISPPPSGAGKPDGPRIRVLRYHKPPGEICSRVDPEGRPTVFDGLPNISQGRWIAVGRLDIGTSGLLLFTNAGELAHRLMHPASGMEREYAVRVSLWGIEEAVTCRAVPEELLERLEMGVELEDGPARFERIMDAGGQGQNHWYHVVIKEGKTHEVRRLWEAVGLRVSRLIRVRYGPIQLMRRLLPGRWEALPESEIVQLAKCVGLTQPRDPTSLRTRPSPRRRNPRRL